MFTHLNTSWDNSSSRVKKKNKNFQEFEVETGVGAEVGRSVGTRVATDASGAGVTAHRVAERRPRKHTPLGLHHSTPSLQTCVLLPNNLIPPSITHSCFQQVILGAAWERACRYGNHSSSWMEPRVVKMKRRRRPLRAAGLFPVPSPRFNGGFTWSGGGGNGCPSQHLNSVMSRLFQRAWTQQSYPTHL